MLFKRTNAEESISSVLWFGKCSSVIPSVKCDRFLKNAVTAKIHLLPLHFYKKQIT